MPGSHPTSRSSFSGAARAAARAQEARRSGSSTAARMGLSARATRRLGRPATRRAAHRHPMLKPVLLVCALFLMGGMYQIFAPAPQSSADTADDIKAGQDLYRSAGCSSCHGMNGEGTAQGPTLVGVGPAAVDFQVATGRMPAAQPGAQIPAKPNRFTDEEIRLLALYVGSFGPGLQIPTEDQYSTAGLSAEDIARGGELFRTNCSACHNFSGQGGALPKGAYAPPLVGVEPIRIWEAMRTGPQQMPNFPQTTLSDDDARSIIAYLETLHANPNRGGFALGGLGPVSEGLWAWLLGMGSLVVAATWIAAKGVRAK